MPNIYQTYVCDDGHVGDCLQDPDPRADILRFLRLRSSYLLQELVGVYTDLNVAINQSIYISMYRTKNIVRTNVDAHSVLSLGARVNKNDCLVSIVYSVWEEGLQIDLFVFNLPPSKN